MRAKRERLGRDDAGQAMAEYGIMLALVSGVGWVGRMTNQILAEPRTALMVGAAIVVTIVVFVSSGRRR